jgi:nicotinate-nucleotide adenylyltransferase
MAGRGIYPGTFDPAHRGHFLFAETTARACGLDEVVFMPEPSPRNKENVTAIDHRVALLEIASGSFGSLVSHVFVTVSPRFTIADTMPELRARYGDEPLTFLIGSDVARSLPYWEGVDALLREASFAIGVRATDNVADIEEVMGALEAEHQVSVNYTLVHTPEADASSSQIRRGERPAPLPAMTQYIEEHQLYSVAA